MKFWTICLALCALTRGASANDDPTISLESEYSLDPVASVGDRIATEIDPLPADPALGCQAGYVMCGTNYCIPSGTVCCASAGHPELYCQAGYTCQPNGTCTAGGGGGGSCPTGQKVCGNNFCIPSTGVCCDSQGHYCQSGYACSSDGQHCVSTGGGGGNTLTCGSTQRASDWDCPGTSADVCGCADACSAGSGCMSGCCMNGYCAPATACQSQCSVSYGSCGGGGSTDPGGNQPGFGNGGGCASTERSSFGLLVLLALGVVMRSRRGRR